MSRVLSRQVMPVRRAAHLVLRALLGLTLAVTATGKALDVPGFHDVLRTYDLFPAWSQWLVAVAMPIIEAGIAATMLIGRRLRWGIAASLILHSSFAVILTVELLRGVHLANCGCFGVFLARPLTWTTPLEDAAMVAITLGVLATLPARRPHRDRSTSRAGSRPPAVSIRKSGRN